MKHNRIVIYVLIGAVLIGAAAAWFIPGETLALAALYHPLSLIGNALRALSLSSTIGNILAIIIYAALSLLPGALAILFWRKRGIVRADIILFVLCAVLFAGLYFAVNPRLLTRIFPSEYFINESIYQIALSIFLSLIYSLALCYFVLRLIARLAAGGTDALLLWGRRLISAAALLLAAAAGHSICTTFKGIGENSADIVFCLLAAAVNALSCAASIIVMLHCTALLSAMRSELYSVDTVAQAQQLSRASIFSLKVNVISCAALNAAQLVFASKLSSIDIRASLPITDVLIALFALLISRLITESKLLKDDNDSII